MIGLPKADKERLAKAATIGYGCSEMFWDETDEAGRRDWRSCVESILTEFNAMGYTLSKRVPVEGKVF